MQDERDDLPEQIEAEMITVEVIDKHSGKKFRRSLPIQYLENGNGIILSGETLDGKPANIHLLSTAALSRISELFGKGADRPRCSEH